MLATLIAGAVAEPGRTAEQAGREWGAYLAPQPPPSRRLSAGEAVANLMTVLDDIGFEPQPAAGAAQRRVSAAPAALPVP